MPRHPPDADRAGPRRRLHRAESRWPADVEPLSATWLDAYSLASLLNQLLGKGKEPFWRPCTRRLFLHGDVKPKQHRVHHRGVAQAAGLRVGARGGRRGHCGRHPALPLARGPRRQRRRPWPPSQRRSCPPGRGGRGLRPASAEALAAVPGTRSQFCSTGLSGSPDPSPMVVPVLMRELHSY